MDLHQELMNKAYDTEKATGEKWSYRHMLDNSPKAQAHAVVLGNMNYQVCNGGWVQWVDNGYCVGYTTLIEALKSMDTELSKKVMGMVKSIGEYLTDEVKSGTMDSHGFGITYLIEADDETNPCSECDGNGYITSEDEEEEEECNECFGDGEIIEDGEVELPDISSTYWNIEDEFMAECTEYLKKII
jgi:hypothetical protein